MVTAPRHLMLERAMAAVAMNPDAVPVVLIGRPSLLNEAREAVAAVGGRVVAELDWDAILAGAGPVSPRAVFVVEARGVDDDLLGTALPRIGGAAGTLDAPVIVSLDPASIDVVAATLLDGRTRLLCDPGRADRALALALAARELGHPAINDTATYEGEAERLRRLNEEVARIAEVLSRLTRRDAAEHRQGIDLADRRQSFATEPMQDIVIDAAEIRRAIRGRRLRDQFFGPGLFEEPAWDMLLDLFAAEIERSRVSVSSLCIAAAVAPTTALRWISKLTEAGLFERQPDPFDRRRAYMELSERASRAMRDYVGALRRAGLSLA